MLALTCASILLCYFQHQDASLRLLAVPFFFLSRFWGERSVRAILQGCSVQSLCFPEFFYESEDPDSVNPSKFIDPYLPDAALFFLHVLGLQAQVVDTFNRLAYDVVFRYNILSFLFLILLKNYFVQKNNTHAIFSKPQLVTKFEMPKP